MDAHRIFRAESRTHAALQSPEQMLIVAFDEVGRGCLAGPVVAGCTLWSIGTPCRSLRTILSSTDDSKRLSLEQRERLFFAAAKCFPVRMQTPLFENGCESGEATIEPLARGVRATLRYENFAAIRTKRNFVCRGGGVGLADCQEIDTFNIWKAVQRAMARAFHCALVAADLCPVTFDAESAGAVVIVDGSLAIEVPPVLQSAPQVTAIGGDGLFVSLGLASVLAKVARDRHMVLLAKEHPGFGFEKHKGYATAEHRAALAQLSPSLAHRKSFLRNFS